MRNLICLSLSNSLSRIPAELEGPELSGLRGYPISHAYAARVDAYET